MGIYENSYHGTCDNKFVVDVVAQNNFGPNANEGFDGEGVHMVRY